MIYSQNINKICALCQNARRENDDEMYCSAKKKLVPQSGAACRKFSYDILKRPVRRMKKPDTDFTSEDFTV